MVKKETIISCLILSITLLCSKAQAEEKTCVNSPLRKGECFVIDGVLRTWNGWPPFLRIEDKASNRVFGVDPPENEIAPDYLLKVLPTEIEGTFYLCPFGKTTTVPYDEREIELVCVESVTNGFYLFWDSKTGDTERRPLISNKNQIEEQNNNKKEIIHAH